MNNYNLNSIQERNGNCYLQTPFYWGPGIPVHTTKGLIERALEYSLKDNINEILRSQKVELLWVSEKQNMNFLNRLLSKSHDASFLPNKLRQQVINASVRKQPYMFFSEREVSQNGLGLFELKLRFSCEVEPHKKGFKHGFIVSIVASTSVYILSLDVDLKIVSAVEKKECILPNAAFTRPAASWLHGLKNG